MAVYRYQVVCVGLWRGKIKRWNTTFHHSASNQTSSIYNKMQSAGWKNPGDVVGDCSGGVAQIKVYNAAGGPPVVSTTYFDYMSPGEWIPYTGTLWSDVDPDTPLDASGESALVMRGRMGSLSASGKPVYTRKYFHAIPSRTAVVYDDPDVLAATKAKFEAAFNTYIMLNPAGVAPTSVQCDEWYGNHQRVRGRRRSVAQSEANAFAGGVVLGAGSAGGVAPLIA